MITSVNNKDSSLYLPTSRRLLEERGWDQADIVFVSGDAYVDHPSFAAGILGRWLEEHGFRVAVLAQPDWRNADAWKNLGKPRLFYAVSAGNMDSMINHYTANRKRRNEDAYSPGGRIELRPDRATAVYSQRCREAFKSVPVITGGVEASLRRIAHYDYWSDMVRPGNLVSSKADLLLFGMGEKPILEIARRLDNGETVRDLRDMRGVAYLLGRTEKLEEHRFEDAACDNRSISLPSYADVVQDKKRFAEMTRSVHLETNPLNARRLLQEHTDRLLVVNPPTLPLTEAELDLVHGLPYQRLPHPMYTERIPAFEMIKVSVQIMRGCFGGCTFCSITLHQGRKIQSRSQQSVVQEIEQIAKQADFKGHISDLGGPTANMYRMQCKKPEVEAVCRRLSCIHPTVCKLLDTSHAPTIELMRAARSVRNVKKVHIASGIRMDLANNETEYMEELVTHHVGGHLKVAPEHVSDKVLDLMKKPGRDSFVKFEEAFATASKKAGKEQYLVPYFIASHPGSSILEMIELAEFLNKRGYKPQQVQDFIPAPMDIATAMYHTGLDPMTMKKTGGVQRLRDRAVQRAMMQFWKPSNYFVVRRALLDAGRNDLIGQGKRCLIPSKAPKAAVLPPPAAPRLPAEKRQLNQ